MSSQRQPKPNLVQFSDIKKAREDLLAMKSERINKEEAHTFLSLSISIMDVWIAIIEDIQLFKDDESIEFKKAYKYINDVDTLYFFSGCTLLSEEVRSQVKGLLWLLGWNDKMLMPTSSVEQQHGFALSYLTLVISVK